MQNKRSTEVSPETLEEIKNNENTQVDILEESKHVSNPSLDALLDFENKRRKRLFLAIRCLALTSFGLYLIGIVWFMIYTNDSKSWQVLLTFVIPATSLLFIIMRILSKPENQNNDIEQDTLLAAVLQIIKEFKSRGTYIHV